MSVVPTEIQWNQLELELRVFNYDTFVEFQENALDVTSCAMYMAQFTTKPMFFKKYISSSSETLLSI